MRSQPPTPLETSGPSVTHVTGQWLKARPLPPHAVPAPAPRRTRRAQRAPGSAWRKSPGYPGQEAVHHGAQRSPAFSHVGSGLTTLPVLVMREPGPGATVGKQSVDPCGQDPVPEPFNPPMNDPQWIQSTGSLVRETRSLSAA